MQRRRVSRIVFRIFAGAAAAVAILMLAAAFLPLFRPSPGVEAHPYGNFDNAKRAAAERIAANPGEVRPECRDILLDHGTRTRDVYVLLHGLTNCPAQFRDFGLKLFERGANVFIPRLPFHGMTDRLTPDQAKLQARDMVASAGNAVDIARGLGDRIIVVGLSLNAVTTTWLAQERKDITLAVAIAPFFAPQGTPDFAIAPLTRFLLRAPNVFVWWDPSAKENLPGSPFSYPRFSTKVIGESMWLGLEVFRKARSSAPATRRILFIASPTDPAIDLPRMDRLAALWQPNAEVGNLRFPADWNVPHDCIDPRQPDQQVDRVYPQLIFWIQAALP
jgi:Esterase/lipase